MNIKSFRVQHYKSITDSGQCFLASDLTILAGKNESGKTALLEALRDFGSDVDEIAAEAWPASDSGAPLIEIDFVLSVTEIDKAISRAAPAERKVATVWLKERGLALGKNAKGEYIYPPDLTILLNTAFEQRHEAFLSQMQDTATLLSNTFPSEPPTIDMRDATTASLTKFIQNVRKRLPQSSNRQVAEDSLGILETRMPDLAVGTPFDRFHDVIMESLPRFIFFSDFENLLPGSVPISAAAENAAVKDFAAIAKLDLAKLAALTETDDQNAWKRDNLLEKTSATVSGDFRDHWAQDKVQLSARADGTVMRFYVREEGSTDNFTAKQRSRGFQWFLSFFLRLKAEQAGSNVILIDEPGLFLHATAQRDVLKVLEGIARNSPVIFSTHSPYLIDADRLDRVRLVLNDRTAKVRLGTRIENKIHKGADQETLTPIVTALGLDAAKAFSHAGKKNVLLEGVSDYYYLQGGFKLARVSTDGLSLIGCVGASKIPQLVSLLTGWALD